MSVTTMYPVVTMPGKYPGFRALLWHFNGSYNSPDISIYFRYVTGIVIMKVLYVTQWTRKNLFCAANFNLILACPGIEIRGRPVVRDHHFLEKDDLVLTDGSPSDDLIFAPVIVLYEEGPLCLRRDYHVRGRT
jgi:hypothetical protein